MRLWRRFGRVENVPDQRPGQEACGLKPRRKAGFAASGGSTASWRKDFVKCRCLHKGCPRTSLLERKYLESYVPKQTAEIHSDCPWHEKEGMKAYPEYYYDAQGRELDWETGKVKR